MKKLIQGAILPFTIFSGTLILLGCEQASNLPQNEHENPMSHEEQVTETASEQVELKSGNMFYIVRDVADMQLKVGDYVAQLKQTHAELQNAVEAKDPQQLQQVANLLDGQLTQLNTALTSLDLKSQEIDSIRQNLQQSTQQALDSPFLKGEVDFSTVDFKQVEQQMGNIQGEMVKLVAMMIPKGDQAEKNPSEAETES